jgi:hypothetical protein
MARRRILPVVGTDGRVGGYDTGTGIATEAGIGIGIGIEAGTDTETGTEAEIDTELATEVGTGIVTDIEVKIVMVASLMAAAGRVTETETADTSEHTGMGRRRHHGDTRASLKAAEKKVKKSSEDNIIIRGPQFFCFN